MRKRVPDFGQEPLEVGAAPAGQRREQLACRADVDDGRVTLAAGAGQGSHRGRQPPGDIQLPGDIIPETGGIIPETGGLVAVGGTGAHQAYLAHDVGHPGPSGEQVVRALLERPVSAFHPDFLLRISSAVVICISAVDDEDSVSAFEA